jgi:hypothetical protein
MDKYLLTIEQDDDQVIHIHAHKKGLQLLKQGIEHLLSKDTSDHTHLFTESWGGNKLTEALLHENSKNIINHLKIFKWNNEDF